jgi:cytochrome b561
MTLNLTPTEIMAGLGVLLVLVLVWRAGARRAKAAADAARAGARLVSLVGRVLFTAVLIVVVQWIVITYSGESWLTLGALGLPALLAGHTLTRALTVTTSEPRRRGGGRG